MSTPVTIANVPRWPPVLGLGLSHGGGNYASLKFIQAAQRHAFNGRRIISKRGRGRLHVANPAKDNVPPMTIVGTAILPLIFAPVDRIFHARGRVVVDLSFGLIWGPPTCATTTASSTSGAWARSSLWEIPPAFHSCRRSNREVLSHGEIGPVSYTHLTLPTILLV